MDAPDDGRNYRPKPVELINITNKLFLNINQLDTLNFYNKFISSLYMFRVHVLIVRRTKIVLYSPWYQHTYRWPSCAQIERLRNKYIEMHGQQNINKLLLLHLVGCLYYCIRDARSHKHQI